MKKNKQQKKILYVQPPPPALFKINLRYSIKYQINRIK